MRRSSSALSRLMFDGPESELTLDRKRAAGADGGEPRGDPRARSAKAALTSARHVAYVAGHSLGEYSALAAAGALPVGDAARLLRLRGQAMQRAVPVGAGAMAALIGLDVDAARAVAAEASRPVPERRRICAVANDNAPGQVVVSGASRRRRARHRDRRERMARRRSVMLPVSAPFHSPLMAPAAAAMAEALGQVELRPPLVPLVANVSARPVCDPAKSSACSSQQVTAMVRWRESVLFLAEDGVEESRRDRRRACARRTRKAHRPRSRGARRSARRPRSMPFSATSDPAVGDVRSVWPDRAGHRRLGRHRRGDRRRAARQRRRGDAGRTAGRGAARARQPSSASGPCRGRRSRRPGGRRTPGARRPRRRWGRSTSWSTMPALTAMHLALRMKDADWQTVHRHRSHRRLSADPRGAARHGAAPARAGHWRSARSSPSPAIPARRTMPRRRRR